MIRLKRPFIFLGHFFLIADWSQQPKNYSSNSTTVPSIICVLFYQQSYFAHALYSSRPRPLQQ
ncbi:hypothetical protein K1T71_008014 [Dendrolimus kikuchii]|uniref:Uncharacterized protein n=1 Tax=Dendrolimus kikuchii TaxID=765133 RepID=A0ACC1CYX0_9NEOP|nr:hypothetical protein K1T71_008014 [Dendrolimus kikuchii]